MIRIKDIKIREDLLEEKVLEKALQKNRLQKEDVKKWYIYKKSIDARKKEDIFYNYTIDIELKDKIGLCLDTCHLNDAGYDISDFDKILDEIALKIGLDKVKCVHINDSKNIIGAHKDRHENIGLGTIGFENLINIIYNERLKDAPKILETPYVINPCTNKKEYPPYKFEIEMIRNKKMNENLLNDIITYYK